MGDGSKENPFKTIGQAAQIAKAGDVVEVGDGIYREWVDPINTGLGNNDRITYKNAPNEQPVISGSELASEWEKHAEQIWKTQISNTIFGEHNPFSELVFGDWYYDLGQPHHTGEVFLDSHAMFEVESYDKLLVPLEYPYYNYKGLSAVKQKNIEHLRAYKWYAEVGEQYTIIWANFDTLNPNEHVTEFSVRQSCFMPKRENINYITVSGFIMEQAATQWSPPTAYQSGVVGPNWSKGWIIENCTIRNSKCVGISLGKRKNQNDNAWSFNPAKKGSQTQTEMVFLNVANGWDKEHIGSHVIRNNKVYDCGQAGIVGHMGCAFSVIEHNHIYNINVRDEFTGLEIAGIKFHAPIDVVLKGNCIHNCFRGLWLDWQAQGTRVSGNAFFENHDNDLYIEVCHGPCIVDNNVFLSNINLLNMSQGTALIHNIFAGETRLKKEKSRFTMYHFPHSTQIKGVIRFWGGDDRVINNIFIGNEQSDIGTANYNDYPDIQSWGNRDEPLVLDENNPLPVDICSNMYFNNSKPYIKEKDACIVEGSLVNISVTEQDGHFYLNTNIYNASADFKADIITTQRLGKAFQPDASFEDGDGNEIVFNTDFIGDVGNTDMQKGAFLHGNIKLLLFQEKV